MTVRTSKNEHMNSVSFPSTRIQHTYINTYILIQQNHVPRIKLTTYFVTSVWDSRHGVVCVANMVRDGGVAMKRHHVFEVCTSEVHHLVTLSLTQ